MCVCVRACVHMKEERSTEQTVTCLGPTLARNGPVHPPGGGELGWSPGTLTDAVPI